ncbi:MAG: hypothetical protein ACOCX1_00845 [Fimbriimonadaceae bacterium]
MGVRDLPVQEILDWAAEVQTGLKGVLLTGSYASATADRYSDVDLWFLIEKGAEATPYQLEYRDERLVSRTCTTAEELDVALRNPDELLFRIPALRTGVVMQDDSTDTLAGFVRRARSFDWGALGDVPDRYVQRNIEGIVEEAHKLMGALTSGSAERGMHGGVAFSTCVALSKVILVLHRQLAASEAELFACAAEKMGKRSEWTKFLFKALGGQHATDRSMPLQHRDLATLELFIETVRYVDHYEPDLAPPVAKEAARRAASCLGSIRLPN